MLYEAKICNKVSAFSLPDDEKVRQEKMSLLNIDDSFKKNYCCKGSCNAQT